MREAIANFNVDNKFDHVGLLFIYKESINQKLICNSCLI